MKIKKTIISAIVVACVFLTMPLTAYANSSWHWVSATRPYDLLPFVIIATLLIEILSINYIARIRDFKRVIPVVTIANLVSFLIPLIWIGIDPQSLYSVYYEDSIFHAINHTLQGTPVFIVSFFFIAVTLVAETPIVYFFLRKKTESKKRLITIIIASNALTTALTFAVERIFCHGEW